MVDPGLIEDLEVLTLQFFGEDADFFYDVTGRLFRQSEV